jgi:SMC interacting uncharacterized protein involved in chromosome segregation
MMAYDGESLVATAIERLNENMMRMDERWNEAMREMRSDFKQYQQATDAKMDKTNELLGKLVHIDTEMKEGNKRIHHRIDEIQKNVEKIEEKHNSGGCFAFKENLVKFEGLNVDTRLKAIETKGSKRWEAVLIKVLEYSAIFIIGAVAFKLGVKI